MFSVLSTEKPFETLPKNNHNEVALASEFFFFLNLYISTPLTNVQLFTPL